ncbi:MAG: hypothetical protein R3199_07580 [Gemmatimonadota bacterium]|nr:hypothetical protein [Gemmatimonadota bacterium]
MHHQGLFLGMHWAWWLFWAATFVALAWAFWRLHVDREETHRERVSRDRRGDTLSPQSRRGRPSPPRGRDR